MVDIVKISDLPSATLPLKGSEFSEIVQEDGNEVLTNVRIDDNDRAAGVLAPKPHLLTDPYDAEMLWLASLVVTPTSNNNRMPGYFCKVTRQGNYNPYNEDIWYTYASFGNVGCGLTLSESDGKHIVHDTSLNIRGVGTIVSKRLNPDPFSQGDVDDTSAAIYLDCATALPANPTLSYANATMIFPFRVGNHHVRLVEPLVQTTASAATLTPEFLSEVAEFTGLLVDATIAPPTGMIDGKQLVIRILASGADRTLTWDAYYHAIGVALPVTAPVGKWVYVIGYLNTNGAKFDVVDVKVQA